MTLENIFFGKKVVKQAYLNNALIYQSKGWETLPSTYQEQWTKNYENAGLIGSITKDDENNIYIGTSNILYKIGPDGDLKWKTKVTTTTITNCTVTGIVVLSDFIYCSYYEVANSLTGYVSKLDKNGNLISNTNINTIMSSLSGTYFVAMVNDNSNIYAVTTDFIFKLDFDLTVIEYTPVPNTANCITTNNGPYVFVGTNSFGVRFNKDNLKTKTNLIGNVNFATASITLNSIGHVYLVSYGNNTMYKFDANDCQLLEARFSGNNNDRTYSSYSDSQDNLYVIYKNDTNCLLKKYSSDGTLIWDNLSIPTAFNFIKIVSDSNDNIYICYIDSSYNLTIKKCINLVKKGS